MPGIDLATDDRELLRLDDGGLELLDCGGRELGRQEAHLIALRVLRDLAERVALDDLGELGARAGDNGDVEAEARCDLPLALPGNAAWLRRAREHDVAALEIRLDVAEACFLERLAKLRHRDPVARAEVDPA